MPRSILFLTLLISLLCHFPSQAADAPLSGSWTGSWVRDGDALTVVMHFRRENAGWTGSFDSDALRVIGIPLRDVAVTMPRITWKIVGDSSTMTFAGDLNGDTLAGEFEEKGAHGTFRLTRTAVRVPEVLEREVAFSNGEVTLSGTLILPDGSSKKVSAIVFLHGSGAEARWASRYLATQFARAGVAALIFDKRGVGQSGGDWRTATYDDLAGDAAAAVEALGKDASIDPARIGIHGHSQGGTFAPLVAAKVRVAFVIASAAAGLPVDLVEIYSLESSVNVNALSAEDAALARKYIAAVVGVAYRGEPREPLLALWEQVRGEAWVFQLPADDSHYWSFSRNFNTFEPIKYWRRVVAPILLVYGAADKRVPPRASAARIADAVLEGAGNSVSVEIFPDADHTFRLRSPGSVWPKTAPGYPDVLIEWIKRFTAVGRQDQQPTSPGT